MAFGIIGTLVNAMQNHGIMPAESVGQMAQVMRTGLAQIQADERVAMRPAGEP
jgi:hypothetical protein